MNGAPTLERSPEQKRKDLEALERAQSQNRPIIRIKPGVALSLTPYEEVKPKRKKLINKKEDLWEYLYPNGVKLRTRPLVKGYFWEIPDDPGRTVFKSNPYGRHYHYKDNLYIFDKIPTTNDLIHLRIEKK